MDSFVLEFLTSDKTCAVSACEQRQKHPTEYFISIGLLNYALFFLKRVDWKTNAAARVECR